MKKVQRLSETEMEVMQIIWEADAPITSSQLLEIFSKQYGKEWKGQTIATFLSRMAEKGVIFIEKQGRSNLYSAKLSPEQYRQSEAHGILEKLYQGSIKNFLSALYSGEKINQKELEEIKEWLSKK